LGKLSGADFDKAYAKAQVEAHQATLTALKDYAANGDSAPLQAFAKGLVPTVTAHLNMAKSL
jgi:putative membrane protein